MFRNLPRYDHYAPNDSPWLGELPSHWCTQRTKSLLAERSQKGYPDEPLLAATQSRGVILKSDYGSRTVTATKDLHLLKLVEVGDFVISLRSFQGGIEQCHNRGIISPAYTILMAKSEGYREYLTYLFKSKSFVDSLTLSVTGIREGQNIDYTTLAVDRLPVPTCEEQAAIVKYLAHANARIDKAIAAKRRLIVLLEEQRHARRSSLVLGRGHGGDTSVSGVNWIGDIPIAWEIRKLRSLFARQGSGTTPSADHYFSGGLPWVMSGDLNDATVTGTSRTVTESALSEVSSLREHPEGSLVVAMYGATIGKTGILGIAASTNQACSVLIGPRSDIDVRYVQLAISAGRKAMQDLGAGGGQPNINAEKVAQFRIPVPPLPIQKAIVLECRQLEGEIRSLQAKTRREVDLLQEFRTRLIADVVTGQVDVRAVADRLPDAPESGIDLADASSEELSEVVEGADA